MMRTFAELIRRIKTRHVVAPVATAGVIKSSAYSEPSADTEAHGELESGKEQR